MDDPHRSRPESITSEEDEPTPQKSRSNEEKFLQFDPKTNEFRNAQFIPVRRRRRRFTPQRRKEVADVRERGACDRCRQSKIRCTHASSNGKPKPSIKVKSKRQSSTDHSNPPSLISSTTTCTRSGTLPLNLLSSSAPIDRWFNNNYEDPSSVRIVDGSWNPDANRDPAAESKRRLSPEIDKFEDIFSQNATKQAQKDEKLRRYVPHRGLAEPLIVNPLRVHLPGEAEPWDQYSQIQRLGRQPRRTRDRTDRVVNNGVASGRVARAPRSQRGTSQPLKPAPGAMVRRVSQQSRQSHQSQNTAHSPVCGTPPRTPQNPQMAYDEEQQQQMYIPQTRQIYTPQTQQMYTPQTQMQPQMQIQAPKLTPTYRRPQPYQDPMPSRALDSSLDMATSALIGGMNHQHAGPWTSEDQPNMSPCDALALQDQTGYLAPLAAFGNTMQPGYGAGNAYHTQASDELNIMAFGTPQAFDYATSQSPSQLPSMTQGSSDPTRLDMISNHSGTRYVPQQQYAEEFVPSEKIIDLNLRGLKLENYQDGQPAVGYDATAKLLQTNPNLDLDQDWQDWVTNDDDYLMPGQR